MGVGPYLKEKVDTFIDKEFDKQTSAQEAARFLFRVLCNEFVDDFVYVAAKTMITMEDFVAQGSEHDQTKLRDAYQEYVAKCSEAACGAIDRIDDSVEVIPGDESSEARGALHTKAMKLHREYAQFHHATGWMSPKELYKSGGAISGLWQASRAGKFKGEAGKDNSLIMLSADMFPTSGQFGRVDCYKSLLVEPTDLTHALQWMLKAKGGSTITLAFDGRASKLRRCLEDWAEGACTDPQRILQGYILLTPPLCERHAVPGPQNRLCG